MDKKNEVLGRAPAIVARPADQHAAGSVEAERALFEAWLIAGDTCPEAPERRARGKYAGEYVEEEVQLRWEVWQAARVLWSDRDVTATVRVSASVLIPYSPQPNVVCKLCAAKFLRAEAERLLSTATEQKDKDHG